MTSEGQLAACLLAESLARAGSSCGALCGPTAPIEVLVLDPVYAIGEVVVRGAESRVIEAPKPSADEPSLIAYAVVEDHHAGLAHRLEWPWVARSGERDEARLVALALARANRMSLISVPRAPFGGHLLKLRHGLTGPAPLPPVLMLTILVEGDRSLVLPPLPQEPPPGASPSDA